MTEKQRRYVEAYVGEAKGNATEAARIAGYKCPDPEGSRLLGNARIQEAITNRLQEAIKAGDIPDATEVLRLLGDHARASMGDFFDVYGRQPVINLDKAEKAGKLHLIKKIKFGMSRTEIELQDQQGALNTLARHYKLLTDTVKHEGSVSVVFAGEDKLQNEAS